MFNGQNNNNEKPKRMGGQPKGAASVPLPFSFFLFSTYLFFYVKGFFFYQADLSIEEYRHIFDTYNQDISMYTLARLALLKALSFDGLEDAHFLV